MANLASIVNTDNLEAQIQSRIGVFLGLKARIIRMRDKTKDPNTHSTALTLYQSQLEAEEKLKRAMAAIDDIKANGPTLSKISTVGIGASAMEYQIQAVNDLERPFIREQGGSTRTDWFLFARTALLIGSALFFVRRIVFK